MNNKDVRNYLSADNGEDNMELNLGNRYTENDSKNGAVDDWIDDGISVARIHSKPRRELFTPVRVHGAPPCKALHSVRLTQGFYVSSGERFCFLDTWTSREKAHRVMKGPWLGLTAFLRKTDSDLARMKDGLNGQCSDDSYHCKGRHQALELAAAPVGGFEETSPSHSLLPLSENAWSCSSSALLQASFRGYVSRVNTLCDRSSICRLAQSCLASI